MESTNYLSAGLKGSPKKKVNIPLNVPRRSTDIIGYIHGDVDLSAQLKGAIFDGVLVAEVGDSILFLVLLLQKIHAI